MVLVGKVPFYFGREIDCLINVLELWSFVYNLLNLMTLIFYTLSVRIIMRGGFNMDLIEDAYEPILLVNFEDLNDNIDLDMIK